MSFIIIKLMNISKGICEEKLRHKIYVTKLINLDFVKNFRAKYIFF